MRVIVVRHFRTVNNEKRLIMGWGDAPRAKDWQEDLIVVDRVFNAEGLRFDAVYSSALDRARQTALYFADRQRAGPVTSRIELNEINYGDLFGMTKQQAVALHPLYKIDPEYVFPGGESFQQMQSRSVALVRSLETRHADDTLLLVAHAGVIRGLICHFLGLTLAPHLKRQVSHRYIGDFHIRNGGCVRYNEPGEAPSGFVRDRIIGLPYESAV